MSFAVFTLLTMALMTGACWVSNLWPGVETWRRAAASRLVWWGLPFTLVAWMNGAPLDNAAYLGLAAWAGAWVPHVRIPDVNGHWPAVVAEAVIVLLRVAALLAPPACVFWLCGAYWPAMLFAAGSAAACMQAAVALPHGWPGLRDARQVSGVLFGTCVGFWLAVAVWSPPAGPDLLP